MIKAVQFLPEHMVNIEKEDQDSKVLEFIGNIDHRAEMYARLGPAISLFDGDTVLAVGGAIEFWNGSGEAWMMVSPDGRKKKLALYKTMHSFLDDCFSSGKFHRLQACILFSHKEAQKCAMRLGFIPEGMMIHYGPNKENYIRFVRV
jgi:hypothetical protein